MNLDTDVLVVGNGPVGLLTLTMLGQAGLRTIGIDRDPVLWSQARAVHFDDEILRIMQSIGLGERIGSLCSPMRLYRFENEAREDVVHHVFGSVGPQGWPIASLFHQPDVDAALLEAAQATPGVDLRPGSTLVELVQEDGAVRAIVQDTMGHQRTYRARWVIGADGATSTVRKLLGVVTENLGHDEPWLVVDGVLRGKSPVAGDMVVLGHHSRPGLWLNLPRGRARLELKVLPGDDRAELVTPEGVARASNGLLTPDNFDPDRMVVYTFRSRLAERWRVGDVFLVGDAAHQAPPLFGQGLCAGVRDAANLVWKLQQVATGLAGDDLLDTYESERKPHARYWVEQATRMAQFAQTTDPGVAAQRDAVLRQPGNGAAPPAPPLGPGRHLRAADANDASDHSAKAPEHDPAGMLAPQPLRPDGSRFDDGVGRRFVVALDAAIADPDDLASLALDPDVVLRSADEAQAMLAAVGHRAVVVRPDRYVLGVADSAEQLRAVLALLPTRTGHSAHQRAGLGADGVTV